MNYNIKNMFLILFLLISFAIGKQSKLNNDLLWLAEANPENCDKINSKIKKIITENLDSVFLMENVNVEELKSEEECFISFTSTKKLVKKIRRIHGVKYVMEDLQITLNENWNLDRIDQINLPLKNNNYNPIFTGKNQNIYIFDTGIKISHSEFQNRASHGANFIENEEFDDKHGHGSHCAGTAAGITFGAAPKSKVINVKVLSARGTGSTSGIIKGLNWVKNKEKKKSFVISLSLGGGKNQALEKAVLDASKKAIVVVAAGNNNGNACLKSPAGIGGSNSNVITVGSTDKFDSRSSFSNFGKCVDVYAPGSSIKSVGIKSNFDSLILSGTSMATPLVAGVAAQFLEKHNGNLEKARSDLINNFLPNKLKNVNRPNFLLQIQKEILPPTPPTLAPTRFPTKPYPTLNINSNQIDFKFSRFGKTDIIFNKGLNASIIIPKIETMCQSSNENFNGKIVLVLRGICPFYNKVLNCQKQGAIGVLIKNDSNSVIFEPGYYGNSKKVQIPSAMISKKDAIRYVRKNDSVFWGSRENQSTDVCTFRRRRRRCKKRKQCKWDSTLKKCFLR